MYIVLIEYIKPIEQINEYLEEHKQHLLNYYKRAKIITCGPQVPRTGGIIFFESDSKDEVKGIVEEDPFVRESLVNYQIIEFNITEVDGTLLRIR